LEKPSGKNSARFRTGETGSITNKNIFVYNNLNEILTF
jgi:hypothetical protein